MTWIRLTVCLVVMWTIAAISYNSLKVIGEAVPDTTFFLPEPSPLDAIVLGTAAGCEIGETAWIDRRTGERQTIELPRDFVWDLMSVSPWCDSEGRPQAVGRWASRTTEDGGQPFCGLGLFRLPEGTLAARIATDVLPTGRACFVPGRTGEIMFPAGDGQLYRCTIGGVPPGDEDAERQDSIAVNPHEPARMRPVTWECPMPASGRVFLQDPAWGSGPKLKHLVFVALSSLKMQDRKPLFEPPKIWWLDVDDGGETILRAAPLEPMARPSSEIDMTAERFPTIVVDRSGNIGLVYLSQRAVSGPTELRWARLEVDATTGVPSASAGETLYNTLAPRVQLAPLVVGTDGRSVFAASARDKLVRFAIPEAG
jgi:hypothetical protein